MIVLFRNSDVDLSAEDSYAYHKLATLTIKNCKASRAEDKDEILDKIHDVASFDAILQHVIFSDRGLLKRQLAGFDNLEAAARVGRRVRSATEITTDISSQSAARA